MKKGMQPSLDAKYPALILKMGGGVIQHGALAVARTLGRCGVPVYAIVEDAYTPLARTRYLTKAFIWESYPTDSESFVKAMSSIAEFIARPTIIIPISDLSAVLVAENAASLASWFLMPPILPQLPSRLANKACLHALCNEIGIPCARSVIPKSFDDVKTFVEGTQFPLLVKALEQWHPIRNMVCTQLVRTPERLFDLFENFGYEETPRLMIQEYVPGDDWICHGYYNAQKNISLTFTGRKLRAYPAGVGATALGLSIKNEALRSACENLLNALGYSGIIDMDWRRDQRDGRYKIVDCNPRVGQNFRMFENSAGIDVVRAQHLDLSGRHIDNAAPIEDRLFTVESFNLMAFVHGLPRGAPKQDSGEQFQAKSKELAWWSNDDPVPFFMMSIRLVIRVLGRASRSWRNLPTFFYSRLLRLFSSSGLTDPITRN
jgi:D-aspartate ligase